MNYLPICAILLCLLLNPVMGQELKKLSRLPAKVNESSGIEVSSLNEIWNINDSGGETELYLCDTSGNLIQTLKINGSQNRDWEDLAQDDQGNFFIGNMGNNNNSSRALNIYKITNPKAAAGEPVQAEEIQFSYEDQFSFPPPKDSLNFDCEAIFWWDDHLYLFSKHRTLPMRTNLYRIPDSAGTYVAKKLGSFQTGGPEDTNIFSFWITAADISPNGSKVCLLSQDKMWIFYNFEGDNFLDGQHMQIDFPSNTQKEAVCFVSESLLYITDEEWAGSIGRYLYSINIQSILTNTDEILKKDPPISVYPNPSSDQINITHIPENQFIEIIDLNGIVLKRLINHSSKIQIDVKDLPKGSYYIRIKDRTSGKMTSSKLIEKI